MAIARNWKMRALEGPHPVRIEDIGPLNQVFSDAFTERYRRDGMVGVRVPFLNPVIWRYAIEDADGGAMLWRGERGEIAAFNIAHRSGVEGWMGPLAVRQEYQGSGLGKDIVREGIEWLKRNGARVIGLETMPRTMDNIGFYAQLGFMPGRLTFTITLDAVHSERAAVEVLSRAASNTRAAVIAECRALVDRLAPGYDYTREIELTEELGLGDTVLLRSAPRGSTSGQGELIGFALCHSVPLVEGRVREELRVLKLVLAREGDLEAMTRAISDVARRGGSRRVAYRVQGEYVAAFQKLIAVGGRVRWTDLRMSLNPVAEPAGGIVWSNWEI